MNGSEKPFGRGGLDWRTCLLFELSSSAEIGLTINIVAQGLLRFLT